MILLLLLLCCVLINCAEATPEPTQSSEHVDREGESPCGAAEGQLFDASYPWNQRIDDTPTDPESDIIIDYLQTHHTADARFRIDGPSETPNSIYGVTVLTADDTTPHESFRQTSSFYSPDCDPAAIPVPDGAIESEQAFSCDGDGDCHLIVVDTDECRLFEMWRANRTDSGFEGGCLFSKNSSYMHPSTVKQLGDFISSNFI